MYHIIINTFLKIILIIVFFQSSAKTDDIKDFEIDGMSIGDSLLDFFTKNNIWAKTAHSGWALCPYVQGCVRTSARSCRFRVLSNCRSCHRGRV